MQIFANYQETLSILLTGQRVQEWRKPVNWLQYVLPRHLNLHSLNPIAIKDVSTPALSNIPQILYWFAEIKAVLSRHIAQFYANLWMHFLATSTSVRLLCYQAGSRNGMRKLGEMGQKRRSSLLASPHLSVLMGHLPCKSSHGWIIFPAEAVIHLPGNSCDKNESHESFALHENIKAVTWDHRFGWNDIGNPYLNTYNHSRPTENENLPCGVWDHRFSHILWAL